MRSDLCLPLRGRILVVEDTEDHRTILKLLLQRAGVEVICIADGHETLPRLEQACSSGPPIGLVVAEIVMPQMNGLVSAKAVRSCGWNIPPIVCSAAVMPERHAA
jgi:CheY-like chemotaxis protein